MRRFFIYPTELLAPGQTAPVRDALFNFCTATMDLVDVDFLETPWGFVIQGVCDSESQLQPLLQMVNDFLPDTHQALWKYGGILPRQGSIQFAIPKLEWQTLLGITQAVHDELEKNLKNAEFKIISVQEISNHWHFTLETRNVFLPFLARALEQFGPAEQEQP
jgi:hypothetical protein